MRSIVTRCAMAGLAGMLAVAATAPASAAVHHKRMPAQGFVDQPVAARPEQTSQNVWRMQNDCVSDEGFGRYSSCDGGGGN